MSLTAYLIVNPLTHSLKIREIITYLRKDNFNISTQINVHFMLKNKYGDTHCKVLGQMEIILPNKEYLSLKKPC